MPSPPGSAPLLRWAAESFLRAATATAARPPGGPKSWLVLGYSAIGDAIMFLPVLRGLRRAYPGARITFVANTSPITRELIPATGLVDEVEMVEWDGVSERRRLEVNLRLTARGYEGAILTLPAPAHFFQRALAAIPIRAGHLCRWEAPRALSAPARLAWSAKRWLVTGELSRRMLLNRRAWLSGMEPAVERNLKLLEALGVDTQGLSPRPPLSDEARRFADGALAPLAGRRIIGVHLGEPDNPYRKIWPAERFGRLIMKLRGLAGVEPVLVGGKGEEGAAQAARGAAGYDVPSWVGRTGLIETFALIERCQLFIANDTGLAKAAVALGVPTASLWGPTDPEELGPPGPGRNLNLRTGIKCSPCIRFGMAQPRAGIDFSNCGHCDCLVQLTEDAVWEGLVNGFPELLGPKTGGRIPDGT